MEANSRGPFHRDVLRTANGKPLLFKLEPYSKGLHDFIEIAGGQVLLPADSDDSAIHVFDAVTAVSTGVGLPARFDPIVINSTFIVDSYCQNEVQEMTRYRLANGSIPSVNPRNVASPIKTVSRPRVSSEIDEEEPPVKRRLIGGNDSTELPKGSSEAPSKLIVAGRDPIATSSTALVSATNVNGTSSERPGNTESGNKGCSIVRRILLKKQPDATSSTTPEIRKETREKSSEIQILSESPNNTTQNEVLPVSEEEIRWIPHTEVKSQRAQKHTTKRVSTSMSANKHNPESSSEDSDMNIVESNAPVRNRTGYILCSAPRRQYTIEEGQKMLDYVCSKNGHWKHASHSIFKEMERDQILSGRSFWSLHEHFRKKVYPNLLKKYRCSPEDIKKFQEADKYTKLERKKRS